MAFDEDLARRLKIHTAEWGSFSEKKMFGRMCYLLNGNMCFGIYKNNLIVRVGEQVATQLLSQPHIKPFDITGKAMKGWAMISPEGYAAEKDLMHLIELAKRFTHTLPPK